MSFSLRDLENSGGNQERCGVISTLLVEVKLAIGNPLFLIDKEISGSHETSEIAKLQYKDYYF